MMERFRRGDPGEHHSNGSPVATQEGTRDVDRDRDHARLGLQERSREVRERQRDEFGGINWGSGFFGWLVAVGLAAILAAIVAAAGTAIGLSTDPASAAADTIGLAGGIALLVVMLLAYYAGGYVAGRMSRFDGARQGLGVWLWGILVAVALGIAGLVLGSEYNVLSQLNLPDLPVGEREWTTGGIVAAAAIVLGTLLAAVAGGLAGMRYHRRVDHIAVEH
jgi:hypothetical protein